MTEFVSVNEPIDDSELAAARGRLRGFAIHMAVFIVVMIALVAVNFAYAPGELWFAFPMVLWGAPLALHAAYVMGLFGGLYGKRSNKS